MWQEIIADEENQEHPVIDCLLEIETERCIRNIQFDFEIFSQGGNVKEDEGLFVGGNDFLFHWWRCTMSSVMALLTAFPATSAFGILGKHIFSQDAEIWFVSSEGKHDKIGVLYFRVSECQIG